MLEVMNVYSRLLVRNVASDEGISGPVLRALCRREMVASATHRLPSRSIWRACATHRQLGNDVMAAVESKTKVNTPKRRPEITGKASCNNEHENTTAAPTPGS